MIKPLFKMIGTLSAGCVVGVVIAMQWTGQADLNRTLNYVSELEAMIKTTAGDRDVLLERLKEQQAIYRNDVRVYYEAVKEGNTQTTKANEEIEKANKAAADLKIKVAEKVSEIENQYGGPIEIPDLITNRVVNHPNGDHDNGVDGITGGTGGLTDTIIHSKDLVITKVDEFTYRVYNTKPSNIDLKYTGKDGKPTSVSIKATQDGGGTPITISVKPGGSFRYTSEKGVEILGAFNGKPTN